MKNPISLIKRGWRWFADTHAGLSKKYRWYLYIAWINIAIGLLIGIFEPFAPWCYPLLGLNVILTLGFGIALGRHLGFPLMKKGLRFFRAHPQKILALVIVLIIGYSILIFTPPFGRSIFGGKSSDELRAIIDPDYETLKASIFRMDTVLRGLRANEAILKIDDIRDLTPENKERIIKLWTAYLKHMQLYDSLINDYRYFYRIFYFKHKFLHNKAYLTGYTAFISRYLCGAELLALVGTDSIWETILDEPIRELDIPVGMYSRIRDRVIHFNDVARLTVGYGHLQFLKPGLDEDGFLEQEGEIFDYIEHCFAACARHLALGSAVWVPKDGLETFKKRSFDVWFPVQKGAAGLTGNIRFTTRHDSFITQEHLDILKQQLEPGDILVERRNWYLSNVGIPGFWPHAAMYTGDRDTFIAFFKDDPEVQELTGNVSLAEWISTSYPEVWHDFNGDKSVIEAIAPGVVFNSLIDSAGADYTGIMRPRLSKADRLQALMAAFSHYHKPYDYNFDFITDSALVCTELVFKSYMAQEAKGGIAFPLIKHAGRDLCTAQEMVKMFDQEYDRPQRQLDFVAFLDYDAEKQEVIFADLQTFRNTWKREKWSIKLE